MRKITFFLSLLVLINSARAAELGSADVYGVAEISFSGATYTKTDAPARDVDFYVIFRHESGSPSYKIYGFWDGDGNGGTTGNVFKVRFCPTKTGKWYLNDVFSNTPELNNEKEGDYITGISSTKKGFWVQDANSAGGRWFKRSDGSHQYIVGNTHYDFLAAPNGKEATTTSIRTDIAENAKHINKVRFQVSPSNNLNNKGSLRSFFDGSGNQTFTETDRPNPKYFTERVDAAVKEGFEKDVIADLIIGGGDQKITSNAYLKYIVARYAAYSNVWFCLNNEWNEVSSASSEKAWGVKLDGLNPYPNPTSTHATRGWTSELNGTWVTHAIRQGKLPEHLPNLWNAADAMVSDYSSVGGKPAINDENGYDPNESSELDVLEGILGSFAGGGYGTTGHKTGSKLGGYFWGYTSQGWTISVHPSIDNLGYLKNVIEQNMDFWKFEPKKPSESIFAGANSNFRVLQWASNQYVLASDNSQSGITANLPSGTWTIYQYNIATKTTSTLSTTASGSFNFSTPNSRACITFFKKSGGDVTPPPTVTLTSPADNNTTTSRKPTFSWNAVTDAGGIKQYDITIGSTVYNAGNNTSFTPASDLDFGTVTWKVRAVDNANNNGLWSAERTITIEAAGVSITGPATTVKFSPKASITANGSGANLSWSVDKVGGANIKTGTGSSIIFDVPQAYTNGDQIQITLTGDGGTDSKIYDIIDLFPQVTTVDADLNAATVGTVYSDDIEAAGGNAPYSWSATNLPAGLTLSQSGGSLSGTPTASGTFSFTVTVTDNDGDLHSKDLSIVINPQPAFPSILKVNFQPSSSSIPAGYIADFGAAFGAKSNGYTYGFNADISAEARERVSSIPAQEKTLIHIQKSVVATWEIEVPNGSYEVSILAGDPSYSDQVNTLNIEGTIVNDPDGADFFDSFTRTVTVSDGKLTISAASGASNAKLAYVHISPVTTPPPASININFQPSASSVPANFIPEYGNTYGAKSNGYTYGFNQSITASARERTGTQSLQDRTLIHIQQNPNVVWEIALANGSYELDILAGDASFTNQVNNLDIEGNLLYDQDGEDNFDLFSNIQVNVTDGKLTIKPGAGATNAKLCHLQISSAGGNRMSGKSEVNSGKMTAYPNPANEYIQIAGTSDSEVVIYNQLGIEMIRKTVSEEDRIDVSSLAKGLYIIKIGSTNTLLVIE